MLRDGGAEARGTRLVYDLRADEAKLEGATITLPGAEVEQRQRELEQRRKETEAVTAGAPARRGAREELPRPPGGGRRLVPRRAGRGGGAARPERRRQDHLLQHGGRAGGARGRAGPPRRARTSPGCPCTGARGSASATSRRRPRSSGKLTVRQNFTGVLEALGVGAARARASAPTRSSPSTGWRRWPESLGEQLSGGERRRAEVARSLLSSPRYILFDEPFAGVDPIAVGELQRLIGGLRDRGIGVLITDHNVREALGICSRAYILSAGTILEAGTPAEIAASPQGARGLPGREVPAGRHQAVERAMGLELKQHLKMTQQLVMTPQLQQAIKLLQLSRMELVDLVRTEMTENPLLEGADEPEEEPVQSGASPAEVGRARGEARAQGGGEGARR